MSWLLASVSLCVITSSNHVDQVLLLLWNGMMLPVEHQVLPCSLHAVLRQQQSSPSKHALCRSSRQSSHWRARVRKGWSHLLGHKATLAAQGTSQTRLEPIAAPLQQQVVVATVCCVGVAELSDQVCTNAPGAPGAECPVRAHTVI